MCTPFHIRIAAFAAAVATTLVLAEAVSLLAVPPEGGLLLAQAIQASSKS
jgi:hypothetical protein